MNFYILLTIHTIASQFIAFIFDSERAQAGTIKYKVMNK